eukprot:IDg15275t1
MLPKRALSTEGVLTVYCVSASAFSVAEDATRKPFMLPTFSSSFRCNNKLRSMVKSSAVAIIHNWMKLGPFYPRMFDFALIQCEQEEISDSLLVEMHRVLRLKGFLVAVSYMCPQLDNMAALLELEMFQPLENEDGIFIAQRLDV